MEPSVRHDRADDISKLESKVVLALSRLQKGRYPKRRGKFGGVARKQVVDYLVHRYCYLDGDIESQVMTALLSCVKVGIICALKNGRFRLLIPNSKNMASNCVIRTSHGHKCICLNLIQSKRNNSHKTCCSYKADGTKIEDKTGKSGGSGRPKRRQSVTKKPSDRTKLKAKRQMTRRTRRAPVKCIQKEEKALAEGKEVAPPVGRDGKIEKCKYCLKNHPRTDSSGKRLCPRCHPPGTRYGVPTDKFSPREEVTSN